MTKDLYTALVAAHDALKAAAQTARAAGREDVAQHLRNAAWDVAAALAAAVPDQSEEKAS